MGAVAERAEGSLAAIRESLDLVHAQMGSMDARMGLLDTAYQQVASQLDLHSRAVSDHTRVMDAIERRQEVMAQHMAVTAEAVARLCGSEAPSVEAAEEVDPEPSRTAGKGIMRPASVSGCGGAPQGGGFHPGASPCTCPPDPGRAAEPLLDLTGRTPRAGGATVEMAQGGDAGRGGDATGGGKIQIKLSFPRFDGEFPRIWRDKCLDYELGDLTSLQVMVLSQNQLSGSLPLSFARMHELQYFTITRNSISGTIPEEMFKNWTKLWTFAASNNRLTGTIPSQISKCKELVFLSLDRNNFIGSVLVEMGSMPNLQLLALGRNHLTGVIPSDIGNATSLKVLGLKSNHLGGKLPATISYLINLVVLLLSGNKFTGMIPNVPGESKSVFCHLTHLQLLDVSNNQLFGDFPRCLWKLKDLQSLDLSGNAFSGEVPTSTNCSSSLTSLHLSKNNFTGSFPAVLQNFKSLIILDLGNNNICGTLPPWIGESNPLLRILGLRSNMFYGSIPWQLSQLSHLQLLVLAENKFVGTIPESFINFSLMRQTSVMQPVQIPITDYLHSTDFENGRMDLIWKGREYTFEGRDAFVTGIDHSGNSLMGEIPSELTKLSGIQLLNLSRNYLSGGIPKDIGNLKLLESLDLSWNKLSGHIPLSMSNLMFLNNVNLSNNLLSGEIPTGSQLQTLNDPSIYSNNEGLCGPPSSIVCTNNSSIATPVDGEKEHHQDLWLYYSVIAGVVFGFWVWFGALFVCNIWRFAFFGCIDALHQRFLQKIKST